VIIFLSSLKGILKANKGLLIIKTPFLIIKTSVLVINKPFLKTKTGLLNIFPSQQSLSQVTAAHN